MNFRLLILFAALAASDATFGALGHKEFESAPHHYWTRELNDPLTRIKEDLESGSIQLDRSGDLPFLRSLLEVLEISPETQMLLFSTTSLQLRYINPRNPRALFFNEDVYLGYIPGGKIEIVSIDPAAGGIYYIFDIPRGDTPIRVERSNRCMNCHAAREIGRVPGLLIQSVIPGTRGGSLESFRQEETGHGIPLTERFGGWYVTGETGITNHWGNTIGQFINGEINRIPTPPGKHFSFDKYPAAHSDLLTQMVHEHQVGFVNRTIEAAYVARKITHESGGGIGSNEAAQLDALASGLARYLLFADEAPLPKPVRGEAGFIKAFSRTRKADPQGRSLKDFQLRTRMFKHRCSYMIYSRAFQGLPENLKQRVYHFLGAALNTGAPRPDYAYLPDDEKRAIREILKATVPGLPSGF